MARRNIFNPPPPATQDVVVDADSRPRFPNTGAMSGMKSTLRDLSNNAVKEIDPALIEDGGPKDRLAITDADVAALAESIRHHGQQVPVMVRPLPDRPGRYRIVYGRRRLQALRLLNQPAKALVRTLSDEQAIVAQGQENNLRLDPSFIEKALFTAELAESGHPVEVIMDALAIDRPMLSRMTKVARAIPADVVQAIGPAHGVGRRRWEELADLAQDGTVDLAMLANKLASDLAGKDSDDRFALLAAAAVKPTTKAIPSARVVSDDAGNRIAELRDAPRGLTIRLSTSDSPGFTDWLRQHAEAELIRLHAVWKADEPKD